MVAVEIGKDGWWLAGCGAEREGEDTGAVRAPDGTSRLIPSLRGSEKRESQVQLGGKR